MLTVTPIGVAEQQSLISGLGDFSTWASELQGHADFAEPISLVNATDSPASQTLGALLPIGDLIDQRVIDPLQQYIDSQNPNATDSQALAGALGFVDLSTANQLLFQVSIDEAFVAQSNLNLSLLSATDNLRVDDSQVVPIDVSAEVTLIGQAEG
ncbi:MAG: hypothetical protein ABGX16_19315 [Pirellulales bacterium]